MSAETGDLRRYLLGDLADDAAAAIEQEYVAREEMLERVWAAEYDLIDDYLGDRLTPEERAQFERHYLSTPDHRVRVAVARELRAAAPVRAFSYWPAAWKAAAIAALVLLAVGGAWMVSSRQGPQTSVTSDSPPREPPDASPGAGRPSPRSPVVVALSISPINVRGSDDPATLTIAPGTDLVALRLEGEANAAPLGRGRAVVRTVPGKEVWGGPAASGVDARPGTFAQLQIPANALPRDDYVVELFGTDAGGRETERYRYFLRVRAH